MPAKLAQNPRDPVIPALSAPARHSASDSIRNGKPRQAHTVRIYSKHYHRQVAFRESVKGLETQLEDLAKAQKFIFMEYHAIEDAEAWHKIQKILEERVKVGVEVRIFYDDMGSIGFINTDFVKKMECVGIHCRVFNPFVPGLNLFLNNRDHRKITVIDGKVGFTGGYNLPHSFLHDRNQESTHKHEHHV